MLNMSTDIDDEDSNFFARIQAQVVMRKGGATDNGREDTPSTPRLTPARSTPRLTPSRLPSSSFTASLPVTPQHMPSGSAIPSSPVTPQREEGDDEIGFHPKLGRARNIGTDVSDKIYHCVISTTAIYYRIMLPLSRERRSVVVGNQTRVEPEGVRGGTTNDNRFVIGL